MGVLESQANQLGLQAAQDCEKMAKDRTLALQLLHKVRPDTQPLSSSKLFLNTTQILSMLTPSSLLSLLAAC